MEYLAVVLIAILLGGITQGTAGIGFGLVSMAILPTVLDLGVAVPVVAGFGFLACAIVLLRWRRHLDLAETFPLLLGEAVGSPLGVFGLISLDRRWVEAALGALLVGYGLRSVLARRAAPGTTDCGGDAGRPPHRAWGLLAGLVGGVFGGAFNTGGPPLIVYATARGWSPGAFRANLQLCFLFNTAIQLVLLAANGFFDRDVLTMQATALPALLGGLLLGTWLGRRLDPERFRRMVFTLLIAFGALYLTRAIVIGA